MKWIIAGFIILITAVFGLAVIGFIEIVKAWAEIFR